MQKKHLPIILCLVLLLSLCACGGADDESAAAPSKGAEGNTSLVGTENSKSDNSITEETPTAPSEEDGLTVDESGEENLPTDGEAVITSGAYSYVLVDEAAHICAYKGTEVNVTVPDELDGYYVTVVKDKTFAGNAALLEVRLGAWVGTVEDKAFEGCLALKKVYVGSSVSDLSGNCFDGCTALEEIEVNPANAHFSSVDGVLFNKDKTVLVRCPQGYSAEEYTVPSTVKSIGKYAFYKCSDIGLATINEGCTLSEGAFFHCSNLKGVELTEGVTDIPPYCFFGCVLMEELVLPQGVKTVGDYSFFGCVGLRKLTLPESLSLVEDTAFECCEGIEEADTQGDYANEWYKEFAENFAQE